MIIIRGEAQKDMEGKIISILWAGICLKDPGHKKSYIFKAVTVVSSITEQTFVLHFFSIEKAIKQSKTGAKENENPLQLVIPPFFWLHPKLLLFRVPSCEEYDIDSESGKSERSNSSLSSKPVVNRIGIALGPVYVEQFW